MTRHRSPAPFQSLLRHGLTASVLSLASVGTGLADTFVVLPDGTGDFATIQAALDAAVDGDVIELGSGTFLGDGNRDLDYAGKGVTVRSQAGSPEACVLDLEGSEADPHRAVIFDSGEGANAVLEAVMIRGGATPSGENGGAIICIASAPTLRNLIFEENAASGTGRGGAVSCSQGAAPTISDSHFERNSAYQGGAVETIDSAPVLIGCTAAENSAAADGGALYSLSSGGRIAGCVFSHNVATFGGALFYDNDADALIEGTVFHDNVSELVGGAIVFSKCTATVVSCTFSDNAANSFDFAGGAAFWASFQTSATIENTIIAFGLFGQGMVLEKGGQVTVLCCDVFGNEGGDWTGGFEEQQDQNGNFSSDPLFCGRKPRDFTLAENSPCLPQMNECGVLVGALGVGCDPVIPVLDSTWGSLKARFSR
jgi:hypothetical protein